MDAVRISGIGAYLPDREILNKDFTLFPPESLPLIEEKTGIARRRAAPGADHVRPRG